MRGTNPLWRARASVCGARNVCCCSSVASPQRASTRSLREQKRSRGRTGSGETTRLVDRLSGAYGQKWFAEAGVKYQIEFFIFKDVAHLMIDTSGVTLHKRGYRPDAGEAPLRETLAAALAYNARPRADVLFWDPMCGSGTIAIEAAMILSNRAPGLGRTFAAEDFPQIPRAVWANERARAEAAILHDADYEVWASDIDEEILDVTYENALRAGVEDRIRIFNADVRKIEKPDRRGTIVCNPPYG